MARAPSFSRPREATTAEVSPLVPLLTSTPVKIAVVGPGAIGATLAAWLAQAHEVIVCARTPFSRLLVSTPRRTLDVEPPVLTDPSQAQPVDWVLSVTKTYDTAAAARWLDALLGPSTPLAIVQNGVEHLDRFDIPRNRTLPVIIDIPAERSAPGRVLQRRDGEITVPDDELGRRFCALFVGTELSPKTTPDFTTASWRKLALNSAAVVSALTLRPAEVVRNEKAASLMRAIVHEAILVGRAMGAKLDDSLVDEVIERLHASAPEAVNSLLADCLAKRPTEIDARNGAIVRLGAKHGIATPLNEMAVTLIEAASERWEAPPARAIAR